MHGDQRGDLGEEGITSPGCPQPVDCRAGMPVVRVHHRRCPSERTRQFQRCQREEHKLGRVLLDRGMVDCIRRAQGWTINQVQRRRKFLRVQLERARLFRSELCGDGKAHNGGRPCTNSRSDGCSGNATRTSLPNSRKTAGREPATSAKPPTLTRGLASAARKRTRSGEGIAASPQTGRGHEHQSMPARIRR